ncbi:MAG: hypothetical protein JXA30_22860 [Deltaproteobacteria bacterium]|nr:hypothetical protein [Deltaproteobacteria bacterium]
MLSLLLLACLLTFAGCGVESRIEFRICGKLKVPNQLDALRVSILDTELTEQGFALIELTERDMVAEGGVEDSATKNDDALRKTDEPSREATEDGGLDSERRSSTIKSLPVTASLEGIEGPGYLRVQALLEGVEVARFDRWIADRDAASTVDMPLTESCYGRYNCALGQTCVKGNCVVAPIGNDPPACD